MAAPKVEFENFTFEESQYKRGEKVWLATTLLRAVKEQGCEPFELPLAAIDLTWKGFDTGNLDMFIWQMKRTLNADYSHPVILDDYGQIADGFHRVCHAIIDGKTTVMAYRLKKMPPVDYTEPDENR